MTCKNCLHSRVCFDSEGTTRYYGADCAAANVEDLCPCFADRSRYVVRESGAAAAVMKRLLDGEWVETQEVEVALDITFSEGMKLFDFGRTAEWNPAPLNGQKITTMFRLKPLQEQGEWIPVTERLPEVRVPVLTYGRKGAVGIGFTQPTSVAADGKIYFYARYGDNLPTHWMPLPPAPTE